MARSRGVLGMILGSRIEPGDPEGWEDLRSRSHGAAVLLLVSQSQPVMVMTPREGMAPGSMVRADQGQAQQGLTLSPESSYSCFRFLCSSSHTIPLSQGADGSWNQHKGCLRAAEMWVNLSPGP